MARKRTRKTPTKKEMVSTYYRQTISNKRANRMEKSYSAEKRRRIMLNAHNGDVLATARACQALANVSKDPETKKKARSYAKYFFSQYRQSGRKRRKRR